MRAPTSSASSFPRVAYPASRDHRPELLRLRAHRLAGKLLLQRIPQRETLAAAVAFRVGVLLFAQELLHQHLGIAFLRVTLRADVVPEALRLFSGGLEVRADVV